MAGAPGAARPAAGKAAEPPDFTPTEDLVLGLDPEVPLGTVAGVAVDSRGDIYVVRDLGAEGEGRASTRARSPSPG